MIDWLFTNALAALALAVIAALLIWAFRPAPAVRHALWLVVVLKLVSPTGLVVSVPLPVEPPTATVAQPDVQRVPVQNYQVDEELITVLVVPVPGQSPEEAALAACCPAQAPAQRVTQRESPSGAVAVPKKAPFNYGPVLVGIWLAGALYFAWRQARETIRFARFARRSLSASDDFVAEVASVASRLGVRMPAVRVLPGLSSPVLWCLWRPVLLWPAGLEIRLKGDGRRAVLAHELAHLRRRDHWARRLEMVASILHWWNPLFWVARKKMRADAELACDAWATGQADRRAYAEALLEVCSFQPRRRPAPAVGVIGEGRDAMQERLTMIMRDRVPCRLAFGAKLTVALMAVAAIPAWTLGQAAPTAKPADPQVQEIEAQIKALVQKLEAVKSAKKAEAIKEKLKEEVKLRARLIEANKQLHVEVEDLTNKPTGVVWTTKGHEDVRVLKAGQNGVKVVGADGKEIKDVKVIIVDSKDGNRNVTVEAAPTGKPAKLTTNSRTIKTEDGKTIVVEVVGDEPTPAKVRVAPGVKSAPKTAILNPIQGKYIEVDATATQPYALAWQTDRAAAGSTITLSRATYKLGKEQATALSTLLGSIKATVMETKLDGDSLVVTTTPEAQRAVSQIVNLMKGGSNQAGVSGYELRLVPSIRSAPSVPGVQLPPKPPAPPKPPVAPKAGKKPGDYGFKLADPVETFEFKLDLDEAKLEELKKASEALKLALPAKPKSPGKK